MTEKPVYSTAVSFEPAQMLPEEKPRVLTPAAERALREAAERRAALDAKAAELAKIEELHGRGGAEPVRYDDWEIGGIAVDF